MSCDIVDLADIRNQPRGGPDGGIAGEKPGANDEAFDGKLVKSARKRLYDFGLPTGSHRALESAGSTQYRSSTP